MSEHQQRASSPSGGRAISSSPGATPAMEPIVVAQVVVRNVVPIVGILAFGWRPFNVLALYFVDTMMVIAALCAVIACGLTFVDKDSVAGRLNSEAGFLGAGVFIAAFIAVPLGIPLVFMADGDMGTIEATLADRSFYIGAAIQAAFALWTYVGLRRAMAAGATLEKLRVKRRFALTFLRWVALLLVVDTGIGRHLGHVAPFLFVVVYVAVTIFAEIAPDRFLREMPGGAEDADPPAGAAARRDARRVK
jgi:hypothetical protein